MAQHRSDLTLAELAKRSGISTTTVTRMLGQGLRCTIENVDAILVALDFDWPDLVDAVQGRFEPAKLRQATEQALTEIAALTKENRELRRR